MKMILITRLLRPLLVAAAILGATAAAQAQAPLDPAAQRALDEGVKAAKDSKFLVALGHFEVARRLAPESPVVFLNLGLAESKLPTRELRAIAWFGAYLAVYPEAPNAEAVKTEIRALQLRSKAMVAQLIASLQPLALQMPSGGYTQQRDLVSLWAKADNVDAALKLLDGMKPDKIYDAYPLRAVAAAQARAGDLTGAAASVGRIEWVERKVEALIDLAAAYQAKGYKEAALASIAAAETALTDAKSIDTALVNAIIARRVLMGDVPGAQATAAKFKIETNLAGPLMDLTRAHMAKGDAEQALTAAKLLPVPREAGSFYMDLAMEKLGNGDFAGARRVARDSPDPLYRHLLGSYMRRALLPAVEPAEAAEILNEDLENAARIVEANYRSDSYQSIAEAQAKRGDFAGAEATFKLVGDDDDRSWVGWTIVLEKSKAKDFAGALAMIGTMPPKHRDSARFFYIQELVKAGLIAEALAAARPIEDPTNKHRAYIAIARAQLKDRLDGAPDALTVAMLAAANVKAPATRAGMQAAVASGFALAGNAAEARSGFAAAVATAKSIADPKESANATSEIAGAMADAGDQAGARAMFAQIDDPYVRGTGQSGAAVRYQRRAETQAAQQLFLDAVASTQAIADPKARTIGLIGMVNAHADLPERAADLAPILDQAFQSALRIRDPHEKVYRLADIAIAYGKRGARDQGERVLESALQAAAFDFGNGASSSYASIALAYVSLGDLDKAQAALRFVEIAGERASVQSALAVARRKLGLSPAHALPGQGRTLRPVSAGDWLYRIDLDPKDSDSFQRDQFRDLPLHLKTVSAGKDSEGVFKAMVATAEALIAAQASVARQLDRQFAQPQGG